MKTIWLIEPYVGPENATARHLIISRYLEKEGYKAVVICANTNKEFNPTSKPYVLIRKNHVNFMLINMEIQSLSGSKRVLAQLVFQKRIVEYTKRSKATGIPDLIIGNFAGVFGDVVFYFKRKYGTKVILDILDFWPEVLVELGYLKKNSLVTKYLYKKEKHSYEKCDSLFFSIPGGADYIKDKKWDTQNGGKIDISKVHYMNNGIDLTYVNYDKKVWKISDKDLDNSSAFKVGYIGALGKPNDIDLLIDTAKLAKDKNENIVFLIFGSGSTLETAREKTKKYKLDNIIFKGYLDKKYFPSTISRCNLAILNFKETPSLKYGLSNNKFFMYCASGMPVISTVHPRYSIIDKYHCGIIVDHKASDVLDGILKFSNMSIEEYSTYKNNARKVGEAFDYSNIIRPLITEVKRLLED